MEEKILCAGSGKHGSSDYTGVTLLLCLFSHEKKFVSDKALAVTFSLH